MNNKLPKIVAVLGPTASGKTGLSLYLAKMFNGENINADSRQIYKEMIIGTEKPKGEWLMNNKNNYYLVDDVPHYLMDIIEPSDSFSLAQYKSEAMKAIDSILQKGKLPILVGGTGQYIWSVTDNLKIPPVAPNEAKRKELSQLSLAELVDKLKKIDPQSLTVVDLKNPRRLIRALEVVETTGRSFIEQRVVLPKKFQTLKIGLAIDKERLVNNINIRVDEQIKNGLVEEVKNLLNKYGADFLNFDSAKSIGYREIVGYLQGEYDLIKAIDLIKLHTRQYAKRQLTWFNKDKDIHWVNSKTEAEQLVGDYLK